jgi:hypothetical protein
MALDAVIERQSFHLKIHNNGNGTFSFTTHVGGFGPVDRGLEFEGFRIQLHDNGDGTFSPCITSSTGPNDVLCEIQGFRLKLHPTGQNDPNTGLPMYAIVTVAV